MFSCVRRRTLKRRRPLEPFDGVPCMAGAAASAPAGALPPDVRGDAPEWPAAAAL